MARPLNRRTFLGASTILAAGMAARPWAGIAASAAEIRSALQRPQIALIGGGKPADNGRGGRGSAIGRQALAFADMVAICEVDRARGENAVQTLTKGKARFFGDYREVLASDVDAVLIATPDHWHAKIAIEALRAGKDVYCEKPLTLTIDEGKRIGDAVRETGRVLQVGTQQRSEFDNRFLTAVALVRSGRLGQIRRITIGLEKGEAGGPFVETSPPEGLDWERWLGPAPLVPYLRERCHWAFRWWYEYSGGKLTDWGAHHVDIAQWAIGMENGGPESVSATGVFPQPLKNGMPTRGDTYNTAVEFEVTCRFPGGTEMLINHGDNGILLEGDRGRIFVNRGRLTGEPAEELRTNPLPQGTLEELYGGTLGGHMRNFFECVATRKTPVSDPFTHHRTLTTCHLANLALRLGRTLNWDAAAERIVNDEPANAWLSRTPREGYEVG